ncbi:MAG: hypothetical protein HOO96_26415, partial [Polyangiaceae bacterium]|nr:hypothetical protein [Polyangiaceae bacterium]
MRTTLYEKVFIDGFHKPSYVVATLTLDALPPADRLREAIERTLERHPRLRSLVRYRWGVPVELRPVRVSEWVERGGVQELPPGVLQAFEQRLLSTPLDMRWELPLEVYAASSPAQLVLKVHHAVFDATSGFGLLRDFAQALAGEAFAPRAARKSTPAKRALTWLRGVQLRPRVPAVSLLCDYQPQGPLPREPVVFLERSVPHAQVARHARALGVTVSQLIASALLSAMNAYNSAHFEAPPEEVGMMFVRARPGLGAASASFRADTCVVSVPRRQIVRAHHPDTLAELQRAARATGHNDVALAALYLDRKIRGRDTRPSRQASLHVTLSDVTSFGRTLRPGGILGLRDLRVRSSPTSFDHAGMMVSRFADERTRRSR